jgi:hypothetical protein
MTKARRLRPWCARLIGLALILSLIQPVAGQEPTRTVVDLTMLFPMPAQLPAGMALEEGASTIDEVAAGFPDPVDARHVLATYGWAENSYRVYTAPATGATTHPSGPIRLEISLHRFAVGSHVGCAACGAARALPYFAHGRAVLLGQQEVVGLGTTPCELEVVGAGGKEVPSSYTLDSKRTVRAALRPAIVD